MARWRLLVVVVVGLCSARTRVGGLALGAAAPSTQTLRAHQMATALPITSCAALACHAAVMAGGGGAR